MSTLWNKASWVLVPSGIEEDVVFAQKPTSGLGDLTFTRSSDGTRTNAQGVVERTPWNLLQQSEMFADGFWAKSAGVTVTSNVIAAPNGTMTADLIQMGGANRAVTQATSLRIGISCTSSIYIKGTAGETIALAAGGVDSPLITLNGEWQRITYTATSVTNWLNVNTFNGATARNFYLWGAQLVEGTEAKPYFMTTNRQDVPRLDYRNADGTLSSCPRLLLEPQRTNSIRNSSMVGAVAGSPGTLPTNWGNSISGITQTVVGTGIENGLPYVDIRLNGTTTGVNAQIQFESATGINALNTQTWAGSFWFKIISAPTPPLSYQVRFREGTAAGAFVADGLSTFVPTTTLQRFTYVRTNTGATTERIQPMLLFNLTNGAAYDFTIRIAAPQMELGAYATTWVPTTTAAVTRLADTFTRNNIFTNGLITAAGGTWFVDLSHNFSLTRDGATSFSLGDNALGTLGNSINIRHNGGTSRLWINKNVSGSLTSLYATLTDNVKIAVKWNGSTADVFVNGVKQVTATSFTATQLQFLAGTGGDIPKYINQMWLAPTPLSDAECIQLTTL